MEIVEGMIIPTAISKDQILENAVSQTAEPALLAVTGSKGKVSVSYKFHHHSNVVVREKLQQLLGNATVPDSVICNYQIDEYGNHFLLSLGRILDICVKRTTRTTVDYQCPNPAPISSNASITVLMHA